MVCGIRCVVVAALWRVKKARHIFLTSSSSRRSGHDAQRRVVTEGKGRGPQRQRSMGGQARTPERRSLPFFRGGGGGGRKESRRRKVHKRLNKLARRRQQQGLTRRLLLQLRVLQQQGPISAVLRRFRQRAHRHLGAKDGQHRHEERVLQVIKVVRASRQGVFKGTRVIRLSHVRRAKNRRIIRHSSTIKGRTKVGRHIRRTRTVTAVPRTQLSRRALIRFSTNLLRHLGMTLVTRHNKTSLLTQVRTSRNRTLTTNLRRVQHNTLNAFRIFHNSVIRLINRSTFTSGRRQVIRVRLISVVLVGFR